MTDKLEQFIHNNRGDFDMYKPDPEVWKRIEGNAKKKVVNLKVLAKYAAAVLIFAVGFYTGVMKNGEKNTITSVQKDDPVIESEYYYKTQINDRMAELKPYFASDPKLLSDIETDFDDLDEFAEQLKNDLQDNINNEDVIEALIHSYQMKLEILESLLFQLKDDEDEKDDVII